MLLEATNLSYRYRYHTRMLIFFMHGINLQLYNSKLLRISIFDNLPKKLHFRKTCGFAQIAQKKLPKTKIPFHAQLSLKIFPVLRKLRKTKPRKTHCVSCAKIAQKFAKKNFARK